MTRIRPFLLLACVVTCASAVRNAGAEPDRQQVASVIAKARSAIRGQDFRSALKHLDALTDPGSRASEVKELQSISHLGNALIADRQVDEDRAVMPLAASLRGFVQRTAAGRPNDAFIRDVQPFVDQYLLQVDGRSAKWQSVFRDSLREASLARQAATTALNLSAPQSPSRARITSLGLWSQLYEFLMLREAAGTLNQLGDLLPPATLAALRKDLPSKQALDQAETELRRTLLHSAKSAKADPKLSAAVAECLMMYCAADGRLRAGQFLVTFSKYTNLPHAEPTPSPLAAEHSRSDPKRTVDWLSEKQLPTAMLGTPEMLLLPLFRQACPQGRKDNAARYALFLTMLRTEENEAGSFIKKRPVDIRMDSAFALEQARYAAREDKDAPSALSQVLTAVRSGRLTRPCFGSVVSELHPLWMQSRRICDLADSFFLTYAPLFRLIDLQIAGAKDARSQPTDLYSVRLRLAELLASSNYPPDVALGITEGFRTLGRIRSLKLSEEQAAQVEVYGRNIESRAATMRTIPTGLVVTKQGIRPLSSVPSQRGGLKPPYLFVSPKGGGIYAPASPAASSGR